VKSYMFAGGAIVAGLPYGVADNTQGAFTAMRGASGHLVKTARHASVPGRILPRVSIWHGDADRTVAPANATALAEQWCDVHGLGGAPTHKVTPSGIRHSTWLGADGIARVESVLIPGLGHGVPIRSGAEAGHCGQAMPWILETGLSAPHAIADFFGLGTEDMSRVVPTIEENAAPAAEPGAAWPPADAGPAFPAMPDFMDNRTRTPPQGGEVGAAIRRALTAAGLMKP